MLLVCQSGLGSNKAPYWTKQPTLAQEKQIDRLLRQAYQSILSRLTTERWLLEEVARLLVERQEIGGAELRAVTEARRAAAPPPLAGRSKRSRQRASEPETTRTPSRTNAVLPGSTEWQT